jgi:anaerobic magnesium-protoporphyrin IX monomethyl ester cyclase
MRVLFIEPPKDFWFILGQYIPPPFGILTLASYLEKKIKEIEIKVIDCQAEGLDWHGLKRRIENFNPHIVAPSSLSTCNAYTAIRTAETAKQINPNILTVVGGQHFSALTHESLVSFPEIDVVIRGEGERTLTELVNEFSEERSLKDVKGLSFRFNNNIIHTPERPLICDLNSLPFPGYKFVKDHMKKYFFSLMADKITPFAILEGSRGCVHNCSYCSQWRFWRNVSRKKSPGRVVDELEYVYETYGSKFFWITDDNFDLGNWTDVFCDEIIKRGLSEEVTWFCQARPDNVVENRDLISKMKRAGNTWMLVGFDNPTREALEGFRRNGVNKNSSKEAVSILRKNDILCQGTFIIGSRNDSHESIDKIRKFADWLDPDIATFMTLTPFPGTDIYESSKENGLTLEEDWNKYDMIHAVMPTKHLSIEEVQEELYKCYQSFFGSWSRRYRGLLSSNPITRRTYQYLARQAILTGLKSLF